MDETTEAMLHPYGSKPRMEAMKRQLWLVQRGVLLTIPLLLITVALVCVALRNIRGNGMLEANPLHDVEDGGITGVYLANNSVTSAKLANYSISTNKLAAGVVGYQTVSNYSVLTEHLALLAVTTSQLNKFTQSEGLRSPNVPQELFGGRSANYVNKDFCRLTAADNPICLDTTSNLLRVLRCLDQLCFSGFKETIVPLEADFSSNTDFKILDFGMVGSVDPERSNTVLAAMPVILYSTKTGVYVAQCGDEDCSTISQSTLIMPDTYRRGQSYAKLGSTDKPGYFSYVATDGYLEYAYGSCGPLDHFAFAFSYSAFLTCTTMAEGNFASTGLGDQFQIAGAGQYVATAGVNEQSDRGIGITLALWDSLYEDNYPRALKFIEIYGADKVYDVLAYKCHNEYNHEVLRVRVTVEVEDTYDDKTNFRGHTYAYNFVYDLQTQEFQEAFYTQEHSRFPYGLVSVVDQSMVPIMVGQLEDDSSNTGTKLMFYYGRPKGSEYQPNMQMSNLFGIRSGFSTVESINPSLQLTTDGYPVLFHTSGESATSPLYITRCTNKLCQVHLNN
eukprot:gb/GEZN01003367.1/.p1 GENE.gb/GEZN01003367.1/~~gb/GEZN01003367.1/.p1  ORF type:complete len:560 (+),score=72.17 gb/GEZN01003367.1/:57-1736(+)